MECFLSGSNFANIHSAKISLQLTGGSSYLSIYSVFGKTTFLLDLAVMALPLAFFVNGFKEKMSKLQVVAVVGQEY